VTKRARPAGADDSIAAPSSAESPAPPAQPDAVVATTADHETGRVRQRRAVGKRRAPTGPKPPLHPVAGRHATSAGQQGRDSSNQRDDTRLRYSGDLPVPLTGEVPYALKRPELAHLDEAAITELILKSDAWRDVMHPYFGEIDARRSKSAKIQPLYNAETLEAVLLFGRVSGLKAYGEIRARLAGDLGGAARRVLDLERPRSIPGQKVVKLRSGIPSESTMCRHRTKHFPEEKRAEAYLALEKRLRDEHLATSELREEARVLDMDGTGIITHFQAPIYRARKTAKKGRREGPLKLENGGLSASGYRLVTAPDAGYMAKAAGVDGGCSGWKLVTIMTQTGVPLAWDLKPLNYSEVDFATELLHEQMPDVIDKLGPRRLRILNADGGFTSSNVRAQCRQLGVLENIHPVSHADRMRSKRNRRRADNTRIPIHGNANWSSNGHRELTCKCGQGRVVRRIKLGPDGTTIARAEGQCPNCRSVTITSGEWLLAQNPSEFWKVDRGIPSQRARVDYLFGNPLTFHDVVASRYGRGRFGHNEGFHSALGSRFGLTDEKRWFRRRNQAVIEVAMTFAIMHAVSMALPREARAGAAPPLAAAA